MSLTVILLTWLAINAGFVAICMARVARWEVEEYLRKQDRARRFAQAMRRVSKHMN